MTLKEDMLKAKKRAANAKQSSSVVVHTDKVEFDTKELVNKLIDLQDAFKVGDNAPVIEHLEAVKRAIANIPKTDTSAMEYALIEIQKLLGRLEPSEIKFNPTFKPQFNVPATKVVTTDVYDTYKAADSYSPEDKTTSYYGFVDKNGRWFILRQSGDEQSSYRYASPENNDSVKRYVNAWKIKEGLKYSYYYEVSL